MPLFLLGWRKMVDPLGFGQICGSRRERSVSLPRLGHTIAPEPFAPERVHEPRNRPTSERTSVHDPLHGVGQHPANRHSEAFEPCLPCIPSERDCRQDEQRNDDEDDEHGEPTLKRALQIVHGKPPVKSAIITVN